MTTFICSLCKKGYETLSPPQSSVSPEERQILKEKYLNLYNRFLEKPDDLFLEQRLDKAMVAYFATITNGVERIPDSLISVKDKNGYYLCCAEKCK
jgi:hypothetical protein